MSFGNIRTFIAGACLAIGASASNATTLSSVVNVDNQFSLYLSSSDSVLGTHIGAGSDWQTTYSFSGSALTAGVTNYLHLVATNVAGPSGFLGKFTLSDGDFRFANGTGILLTNASDWKVNHTGFDSPMTAATVSGGSNGVAPWNNRSGYGSDSPEWIWSYDAAQDWGAGASTAYFSAAINPVPEPEVASLLLAGLGIVAGVARRRKTVGQR